MANIIRTQKPLTIVQRKIIEAINREDINTVVVKTGRQCAKTTTAILVALNWCLNLGYRVGFFLPVYKQCKKVLEQTQRGLGKSIGEYNKTDMTIKFSNGSGIYFFSADGEIRGGTFDCIIVDEACFISSEVYQAEILPTVGVAMSEGRGKQLIISTPKSKNWFYGLCTQEQAKKVVITATTEQGGIWTKEIIEQFRAMTPDHIFKNEYLAEFIDEGCGVFPYKGCISDSIVGTVTNCVGGLDFGIDNDYTALAIMNSDGELIYLERWRGEDWMAMVKKVAVIAKTYNAHIYAEKNGLGNMPSRELQKLWGATTLFNTTNQSKNDIINRLAYDFKEGNIKIPNRTDLLNELDAYTLEFTPKSGKVTYNARSGFNDDYVIALSLANYHRLRLGSLTI